MEFIVKEISDLKFIAKELLDNLGDRKIIAFEGKMGAGKTTFIQMILNAMGIEKTHGSPTYSIVNEYVSPVFGEVYHFDLYRLNSENEAYDIGIEEMIYGDGYCFIEWPDKILHLLPDDVLYVKIFLNEELDRVITW